MTNGCWVLLPFADCRSGMRMRTGEIVAGWPLKGQAGNETGGWTKGVGGSMEADNGMEKRWRDGAGKQRCCLL